MGRSHSDLQNNRSRIEDLHLSTLLYILLPEVVSCFVCLCSKSGDTESLEAARASLGLAKARLQLPYLRRLVCEDLEELARWKCAPTQPKQR